MKTQILFSLALLGICTLNVANASREGGGRSQPSQQNGYNYTEGTKQSCQDKSSFKVSKRLMSNLRIELTDSIIPGELIKNENATGWNCELELQKAVLNLSLAISQRELEISDYNIVDENYLEWRVELKDRDISAIVCQAKKDLITDDSLGAVTRAVETDLHIKLFTYDLATLTKKELCKN